MSAMDKVRASRQAGELGMQVETLSEQVAALSEQTQRVLDALETLAGTSASDETVAAQIEPLAQSMAVLSDRCDASIEALSEASQAQARAWSTEQQRAAVALEHSARTVHAAADTMGRTVQAWNLTVWSGVLMAALAPMVVLLIASALLLPRGWTLRQAPDGGLWLQVWAAPPAAARATPATEPDRGTGPQTR